jgi:hypothetical protein
MSIDTTQKLMNIDPTAKLKIICVEGTEDGKAVAAQFNPKEIQVDKSVPWQKQKKAKNPADLEFTGAEPMTMGVELMFDGYETGNSVQDIVNQVLKFASVDEGLKRPPKVKVIWGIATSDTTVDVPEFTAVIESVATKYTMFAANGAVLRATVNVKFKQANELKLGKKT